MLSTRGKVREGRGKDKGYDFDYTDQSGAGAAEEGRDFYKTIFKKAASYALTAFCNTKLYINYFLLNIYLAAGELG